MYTVRKMFTDVYEVANFGDRKDADAVYTVRQAKNYQVFWTTPINGKGIYWTTPDEVELVEDV
jgi:hypothetical protein